MAEPRVKWGQILVEKVDRLDQRFDGIDRRVEQLGHRIDQLALVVEGLARKTEKHDDELKDFGRQLAGTAATVRWMAGLTVVLAPLVLAGAVWLARSNAVLTQKIETVGETNARIEVGFERIEAALKAQAEERQGARD